MTSIRVFLWNINGRSGKAKYVLPSRMILDQIMECLYKKGDKERLPEIVILTEVIRNAPGYLELVTGLEELNYEWRCTRMKKGQNQVLIAINRECCDNNEVACKEINEIDYKNMENIPNYLQVTFAIGDRNISVVGCRILVGTDEKDYDDRVVQFYDVLVPEIKSITESDVVIVGGDFNNASYYGELKENEKPVSFNAVEKAYYKNGEKLLQYNYNLHRIQEKLFNEKYCMVDTGEATHKYISEDHIFVKNANKSREVDIKWTFMKSKYGYEFDSIDAWKANNWKDIAGLPDHAIVLTDIEI